MLTGISMVRSLYFFLPNVMFFLAFFVPILEAPE